MRRTRWLVVGALAPALLLVAAGAALGQGTPPAGGPTVLVAQDPALGPLLTDAAGMTLYLFTEDTVPGESTCYDRCAEAWPPFAAAEPLMLPPGVPGELSTVQRADGTTQVAYNGIPLYYWQRDAQPGDTTGQGVGGVWFVVPPGAEFGVVASPVASPAASPMASPAAEGTPAG